MIRCKRVYDGVTRDDDLCVLVDRGQAEWLESELDRHGPGSSPVRYAQ
ncbi:hypothetical protein [Pseudomonas putida]|nr:hypothetical protein [Pseudomonas putida]EKT4480062.1 hypothetical protein [Pseudomonas putida]MDP9521943.1 hypothetical protein [Pseudomonas putida]